MQPEPEHQIETRLCEQVADKLLTRIAIISSIEVKGTRLACVKHESSIGTGGNREKIAQPIEQEICCGYLYVCDLHMYTFLHGMGTTSDIANLPASSGRPLAHSISESTWRSLAHPHFKSRPCSNSLSSVERSIAIPYARDK